MPSTFRVRLRRPSVTSDRGGTEPGADPGLPSPVRVLAGAAAAASPVANGEGILADLPHAKLKVIEACGHWDPIEQPATVTAALRGFL